jgi:hypothetical protein
MSTLAKFWTPGGKIPEFKPSARYIAAMDCLIYLREDCSYRAVRLNPYQTILLHPYEDRPVGVKLKGMRFLQHRLRAIFEASHVKNVNPAAFEFSAYWELALTAAGDDEVADAERVRQEQLAIRALEMVQEASMLAAEEMKEAA